MLFQQRGKLKDNGRSAVDALDQLSQTPRSCDARPQTRQQLHSGFNGKGRKREEFRLER